jgi:hypothetical protein
VEGTPHFNGENRTNGAEHGPAYFFEIERVHGTGLFAPHGEAVPVEHGNELDGLVVSVKEINYDEYGAPRTLNISTLEIARACQMATHERGDVKDFLWWREYSAQCAAASNIEPEDVIITLPFSSGMLQRIDIPAALDAE